MVLGLIFSVVHLVIMGLTGDLEESNLKVWFLAYTLMQILSLFYLVIGAVRDYRSKRKLQQSEVTAVEGQSSKLQKERSEEGMGIEMADKS